MTSLDTKTAVPSVRKTVFVSHAAPEDNEFALWLSSKLAIGGVMKRSLNDPKFMIPIRADDISFSNAPPEFIRGNILDAHPNWHNCLEELFKVLEEDNVPKNTMPDAQALHTILQAREDGRRFIQERSETLLTNWFSITPPPGIRYYKFDSLQEQMQIWLRSCRVPCVEIGRLAASFADPPGFAEASTGTIEMSTAYDIPFGNFFDGTNVGPYAQRSELSKDVANLFRQHFDALAQSRGLKPFTFANKEVGWFFPDGVVPEGKVSFVTPDGRRVRRTMSGKFKELRWHLCLIAKPRISPYPVYRIHANVVLSENGTILPGDKTHKKRRRLTRSWWNHIWRDRLLAAMNFLAEGQEFITVGVGNELFKVASWPMTTEIPISYEASDPPPITEEDDEGNIVTSTELDDQRDELSKESDDAEEAA